MVPRKIKIALKTLPRGLTIIMELRKQGRIIHIYKLLIITRNISVYQAHNLLKISII